MLSYEDKVDLAWKFWVEVKDKVRIREYEMGEKHYLDEDDKYWEAIKEVYLDALCADCGHLIVGRDE